MPALVFLDLTPSGLIKLRDGYWIEDGLIYGVTLLGSPVIVKSWAFVKDFKEDDR